MGSVSEEALITNTIVYSYIFYFLLLFSFIVIIIILMKIIYDKQRINLELETFYVSKLKKHVHILRVKDEKLFSATSKKEGINKKIPLEVLYNLILNFFIENFYYIITFFVFLNAIKFFFIGFVYLLYMNIISLIIPFLQSLFPYYYHIISLYYTIAQSTLISWVWVSLIIFFFFFTMIMGWNITNQENITYTFLLSLLTYLNLLSLTSLISMMLTADNNLLGIFIVFLKILLVSYILAFISVDISFLLKQNRRFKIYQDIDYQFIDKQIIEIRPHNEVIKNFLEAIEMRKKLMERSLTDHLVLMLILSILSNINTIISLLP